MDLPNWAKDHFTITEAWKPMVRYVAPHLNVMVVAQTRIEGTWCAYIRNVPGYNHQSEVAEVLATGDKLLEDQALSFFPYFKGIPYAA